MAATAEDQEMAATADGCNSRWLQQPRTKKWLQQPRTLVMSATAEQFNSSVCQTGHRNRF